jgi:hypothetical protein
VAGRPSITRAAPIDTSRPAFHPSITLSGIPCRCSDRDAGWLSAEPDDRGRWHVRVVESDGRVAPDLAGSTSAPRQPDWLAHVGSWFGWLDVRVRPCGRARSKFAVGLAQDRARRFRSHISSGRGHGCRPCMIGRARDVTADMARRGHVAVAVLCVGRDLWNPRSHVHGLVHLVLSLVAFGRSRTTLPSLLRSWSRTWRSMPGRSSRFISLYYTLFTDP